jgi:S-DNA-T family DNA segregation ATPase FtsK/SpoIIIE
MRGREADLAGIALIALGAIAALGVYAQVAGPLGRAIDTAVGALVGVGRFVVPVVFVVLGVALVREGRAEQRGRIIIGVALIAAGVLGFAHVTNGPDRFPGSADQVRSGGGWLGAAIGQPMRSVLASPGAGVLLGAIVAAGVLVLTRVSLAAAARHTAKGVAAGVRPPVRVARKAMRDISTLSSERLGGTAPATIDDDASDIPVVADDTPVHGVALSPPALYDVEAAGGLDDPTIARRNVKPSGPPEQLSIPIGPAASATRWKLPPASLLHRTEAQAVDRRQVEELGRVLEGSLASHGVETRLVGMTVGPTVTRYELELGPGVKVARVTSLHRDIAYAMAAVDVRILAPIPGRSAIGVEVPNRTRHLVVLGDLLASPEAKRARQPLEVAIGKDIAGRPVFMDLTTMPHLLIAGATGAGKSSGINCIISSLLMRSTPEQVRLILIDPKQVEMGQYARLPHLLTQPVTNPKKAANALAWATREMDRRYDVLSEVGFRDITGYNSAFDRGELVPEPGSDATYERLPYIVVVVDELNDLMMVAARDVEDSITRIAQKARAVGIHLIVATQRPSVNVITGVIKANVPARMAFAVSSQTDSRVILDQPGAERLVGRGDLLLLGASSNVAQRIQGAWVSEEEIRAIVAHWRRQAPEPRYVVGVDGESEHAGADVMGATGDDADDEALVRAAMELVVRSQLGSTSMLQRKLKIGFARAGRIMDLLEQRGVVGPSEGSKARAVLMTPEELDAIGRP